MVDRSIVFTMAAHFRRLELALRLVSHLHVFYRQDNFMYVVCMQFATVHMHLILAM